jgi:hypothetical protein
MKERKKSILKNLIACSKNSYYARPTPKIDIFIFSVFGKFLLSRCRFMNVKYKYQKKAHKKLPLGHSNGYPKLRTATAFEGPKNGTTQKSTCHYPQATRSGPNAVRPGHSDLILQLAKNKNSNFSKLLFFAKMCYFGRIKVIWLERAHHNAPRACNPPVLGI